MFGIVSISTSPLLNPYCKARREKAEKEGVDCICLRCFSIAGLEYKQNNQPKLARNTELLTTVKLEQSEIPLVDSASGYLRFESFGDLINTTQVKNYFNIALKNSHLKAALWTKNPGIIRKAIKEGAIKPANLTIVYSSPIVGTPAAYESILRLFPFIDKVFTVYTKKQSADLNIDINCGARSCATCGRCYENKGGAFVNELLK